MGGIKAKPLASVWAKWYVKVALAAVVVVVLSGAFFVWEGTRHALNEDQVIALAGYYYTEPSGCWVSLNALVTKANPPAFWSGETWKVTVAGPCGLKTFIVYDATGVLITPTPAPIPTPDSFWKPQRTPTPPIPYR